MSCFKVIQTHCQTWLRWVILQRKVLKSTPQQIKQDFPELLNKGDMEKS